MEILWQKPTEQDFKVVVNQLGREPRGFLGVATRCPYTYPQVIVNRPITAEIEEVNVFPTLFWLTCPYLRKMVGQLESHGVIADFQKKIAEDLEYARRVEANHRSYGQLRQDLVPLEVQELLQKNYPKRYRVLVETGVGGIRGRDGVKCLHTHLADYLVREDNEIGAEVVTMLKGKLACSSGNCELERYTLETR